jgi:non-ribosomal peptide synthetase component F
VTFDLGVEIAGSVKELALQQGATLFMVLLAVYCVLLSKLSGQEDIVVGTAVAGRNHPDLEPVIGMFLNMLAIRTFPKGEKAFKEFLAEVIDTTLQAYANQDYPFEDLVEKVVVNREANRHPLFDVGFGIQNIDVPTAAAAGADREPRGPEVALKSYHFEDKTAKFDMNMLGSEAGENVFFTIEYNTNLFKKETIERFIDYYKRLAASVIEDPDRKIKEMEIITEEESMRILSKKEEDAHAIRMDFDL